jgi:hypothetical protein
MKGQNGTREDLLRRADEVRSHMIETLEQFERRSHDRIVDRDVAPSEPSEPASSERSPASSAPTPSEPVPLGNVKMMVQRRRLERRADRVRERLIDRIEGLERKARERIIPVVVVGGAVLAFLTIGFGVLLYRSIRQS